jgi:predicted acyl esterase
MTRLLLGVGAVLLGVAAPDARGQAPDPGKYSPERYTALHESRGHKAVMRDGVRLSVDVYRPAADGRYPAILIHNP